MPDKQQTRLTLIQRVCSGERDDQSWEDFVKTYRSYISSIIRNFNVNESICDDLLQDVLVTLWKNLPQFEYQPQNCRFRTWLSIVCKNSVKTYLRSKAGRNSKKEINFEDAYQAIDRVSDAEVETIAESEWKVFIAEKAMENIKNKLSEKLTYTFTAAMEGKRDADLAVEYKTTEAVIRVYRHRVKNALMKEIILLNKELDG